MKLIQSRDNPTLKRVRRLIESSQARRREGVSVLEGIHLCGAYLRQVGAPELMLVRSDRVDHPEIAGLIRHIDPRLAVAVDADLFSDVEQVESGQGVIFIAPTPTPEMPQQIDSACVLLDRVQDPGNVGAVMRTCAAAGVGTVALSSGCAFAWSPKVLRAGMGAHFALTIHEDCDLAAFIGLLAVPLMATSSHAALSLYAADLSSPVAWLFGNEGAGLEAALLVRAAHVVSIPLSGETESLNVAAAAAVCLFEARRQQGVTQVIDRESAKRL